MNNHVRRCAVAIPVLLAVIAAFSSSAAGQQVSQQLQPPANEELFLQVHAKGDQNLHLQS